VEGKRSASVAEGFRPDGRDQLRAQRFTRQRKALASRSKEEPRSEEKPIEDPPHWGKAIQKDSNCSLIALVGVGVDRGSCYEQGDPLA